MNHLEKYQIFLERTAQSRDHLIERFISVRQWSNQICEPLESEDFVVQPCPEVSPPKWHLGHTTWFFEEMILSKFDSEYSRFDESLRVLFNSYYKSAGKHWLQNDRGHLSRPTVQNVFKYREYIDEKMVSFLRSSEPSHEVDFLLELGLHHEQQHQELLMMDIKYILATNPSFPIYNKESLPKAEKMIESWDTFDEGVYEVGHSGVDFAFDNEGPCHKTYIYPFSIRKNSVSNGEYLEFISRGGYSQPTLWLSEGWDWKNSESIKNPLYWVKKGEDWFEYTLHGLKPLDLDAPVTHISYFEADAFANWTGHRLPTEFELETYIKSSDSNYDSDHTLNHPTSSSDKTGQVWFWTRSHYSPYPGFRTFDGTLGEYNGKFMCNQFVLKGGCVATPKSHYRHSYRNFFQPRQRWMFSGIRLAKDV